MAEGTITSSIGTKVEINTGTIALPVWYEVTNVQSIGEMGGDAADIDVTNLKDTETSLLPGVKAIPSIDIVCFKEKENLASGGNYAKLRSFETAGTEYPIRITFPDATGVTFNARITTKLGGVSVNGAITFTASFYKKGDYTDF